MSVKVGDVVRWSEHDDNNDADDPDRYTAVIRSGKVVEVVDAQAVYRTSPQYKPTYKGERKESKFPSNTVVLRVEIDGARVGRTGPTYANVHESQVLDA